MASKKVSTERLEGWKGVVTGADADVLPGDIAPKGQNAVVTHAATQTGVVRRRKGATPQGNIEGDAAVLGIFDFPAGEEGKLFLVVTDDGALQTLRVAYELVWSTPPDLPYGTPLGAETLNAAATVDGTYEYAPDFGTVLARGIYTLLCTFTPDNLSLFAVKQITVDLEVLAGNPTIVWSNPANITYGDELTGTELNATCVLPGTFDYTPPLTTILDAGTHTLRVDFTPDDLANWNTAFKEVTIVVDKATPVITWGAINSIVYGTALSGTQLNATADVAGSFIYTPPSGTVLNAGMGQSLHVDFTPTDTANYNNADADNTINVNKANPVITWADPAGITYGTLLSGTQLNATADVVGSFVYTPSSGTQLDAGLAQNLHVDFTPTDTANYNSVDDNVSIDVAKATPVITWSNPADITVGTALDGTQLNATADVAGSFVYDPVSGTVLGVGDNQALHADFTPTDTDNYNVTDKTVYINVTGVQSWKEYWLDGEITVLIQGVTFAKVGWLDGQPGPGRE